MRMSDLAAKIVKLITCDVTCGYTNREARMILEIVDGILEKGESECS